MTFPASWSTTTLGDAETFQLMSGLWKGKKPPFTQATVVRNTNFAGLGTLDLADVAVLDVEQRQLAERRLREGDVIIERSGGGPKQPVGRVCYFDVRDDGPYSFSNFTSTVRVRDRRQFLPRFVSYYLLHLYQSGETIPLQRATTGLRNLDWSAYIELPLPRPPIPEQERIASVLALVQRAVRIEEKAIATMRELKRAALSHLLTDGFRPSAKRETELGLLPVTWKVVPLGSLGRIGNGSTPLKGNDAYWTNGSVPWLTSAKVYDVTITQADRFVTPQAVRECHLPMVKAGSVVIAITGQGKTLGHAAVTAIETCVNQHIAFVQFEGEDVNPHFVRLFLEDRYEQLRGIGQGGGSTKGALTCGFLKTFLVPLPPRTEQDEIASALMTLESAVALRERQHAGLLDVFTALLDKLMTGEIRVNELDIDTSEVATG